MRFVGREIKFWAVQQRRPTKKTMSSKKELSPKQRDELLAALKARSDANKARHPGLMRAKVQARLAARPDHLWSL